MTYFLWYDPTDPRNLAELKLRRIIRYLGGLRDREKRNIKNCHPDAKRRRAMTDGLHQKQSVVDGDGDLEVP
jgi:hypothetical protein